MKTKIFFKQFFFALLLIVSAKSWAQITYAGTPTTITGATCPTTTEVCSSTNFYGNVIRANVQDVTGNSVTFRVRKCDGSSFGSAGTLRVKLSTICGTQITSATTSSGGTYKDITFSVSHTGTNYYRITFYSNSDSNYYYTNQLSVTGTAVNVPPTLTAESSCFNIASSSIDEGGILSGSIAVRNTGTSTYSGNVTVFISKTSSTGTQQIITQQSSNISANSTKTISFNQTLTVSPGTYRIWCKYSNAPNGGEDYIENNGCTTCSGIGCLDANTPSRLISVIGTVNLVCGASSVNPAQPIQNQDASFSFAISNTGSANYTGELKMMWRNGTNGVQLGNTLYGLSSGTAHTFTHTSTPLTSTPGNWILSVEDINNNVICSKTVTVLPPSTSGCVNGTGNAPLSTSDEYKATQYLCQNGIIDSNQNWTDNANNAIIRQDIAKIAYLGLYKGNTPSSPSFFFPVPFLDMQNPSAANSYWFDAAKTLAYLQYNDANTPFDRDFVNFNPTESIKRKYAIKLFLEAFNIPLSTNTTSPFSDVANTDEMFKYIRTAYELGILTGNQVNCPSGTCFHPDDNLKRQDSFVVLWRILTFAGINKPTYAQLKDINSYFIPGNNRVGTFGNVPDLDQANFNHYQKTSFSIAGRGVSLDFTHTYNSFLTELPKGFFDDDSSGQTFTPLGMGWTHTYNIYAIKSESYTNGSYTIPAKMMFYYPDGSINVFDYATNQPDAESIGVYDVMTRTPITGGEAITITTKNQTKYVFENKNNGKFYFIKTIKDRNSNGVKINWVAYSGSKYRISTVQEEFNNGSSGRSLTFNYPSTILNLLGSVTDNSINRTINFNVQVSTKSLKTYTDPKGQITQYNYDTYSNYNKSNLLIEIILPKGNKIQNTYVNRKLTASKTFAQNGVVSSTTNVNWSPNYTNSGYNSSSTVTDPQLRNTSYTHNTNGNPTNIVSPTGTTSLSGYGTGNTANLPTNITVNGQSSSMNYDANGNVLNVTKNGISNSFTYTAFNDIASQTDGRGFTTNYSYDGLGNLTSVQRPSGGGTTSISRNSFGQPTSISNPSNITTFFGYNTNGLTNQISLPLGISTSSTYDNASRLLSTTDALGKTSSYQYDANDNLIKSINPLGATNGTVEHSYDANDNHLSIKNPKNESQNNTYNFDDDLLATESFGPHTKSYTYNVDGTLATFTRGNGTFTYTYDGVTGRLLNDGQTQYTYDSRGNVKTVTNTNGTLTMNYDVNDRLENYTDYYSNTVSYEYDNNNNVTKIKYPGNKDVTYVYDGLNRCTSVTDWNGKVTSYTYFTDDRISKITLPNGTYTDYTYDAAGRPTGISNKKSNGTVISSYAFTMDNAGNHLSETITEPSILAGLQGISNQTVNYGQYPFNRIQSQGSTNFTHNTAGAITNKGAESFTYDLNDNLLTAPNSSFSYDGAGNRRAKTVSGVNTRYVLSILGMSQVLMETNNSNTVENYYVYGPTGLLYRVKPNTTNQYYHYDFRGSTTAITNEAQAVTHSYSYDPFGKVLSSTEADFNPYRYVGQHGVAYESLTLSFMRARYYDSTTGRFVSEDPVYALNLYPYADNNPINYIDYRGGRAVSISDYWTALKEITIERANMLVTKAENYLIKNYTTSTIEYTAKAIKGCEGIVNAIETALGIPGARESNQWYETKYINAVQNNDPKKDLYLAGYLATSMWSSLENAKATLQIISFSTLSVKDVKINFQKLTGSLTALQTRSVQMSRLFRAAWSGSELYGNITDVYSGGVGLGDLLINLYK